MIYLVLNIQLRSLYKRPEMTRFGYLYWFIYLFIHPDNSPLETPVISSAQRLSELKIVGCLSALAWINCHIFFASYASLEINCT